MTYKCNVLFAAGNRAPVARATTSWLLLFLRRGGTAPARQRPRMRLGHARSTGACVLRVTRSLLPLFFLSLVSFVPHTCVAAHFYRRELFFSPLSLT